MYPPPHPYPPATVRRWWQHPVLIVVALLTFPPAGIVLAWASRWSRTRKIVATVLVVPWFFVLLLSDPPKKTGADAKPQPAVTTTVTVTPSNPSAPSPGAGPAEPPPGLVGKNLREAKAAASAAGYGTISHDAGPDRAGQWDDDNWRVCFQGPAASRAGRKPVLDLGVVRVEWPCPAKDGDPIPYPKMPEVVGMTFAKASETLQPMGLRAIEPESAYTDVDLPDGVDSWTVCFQRPEEGAEIKYPKNETARLKLTAPGTSCPKAEYSRLRPVPAPPSSGDDEGSGSSSGGGGGAGAGAGGFGGVQYGRFCSPVGARATTTGGGPAKCFMGKDGRARWGYGS